jgi:hypothetical protein
MAATPTPSQSNMTGNLDLADPSVVQRLTGIYKNATKDCLKEMTREMNHKFEELEVNVVNHDIRLESVEKKIDEIEQLSKNKNIIIRGVPAGKDVLQKSLELINNVLKFTLKRENKKYAVRIGKEIQAEAKPVRVVFEEEKTRDRVYKARTKIANRNVWFSEDLTQKRADLAYQARRAVRDKLAIQTWTFGGNIFIKTEGNTKPKKIEKTEDLPQPSTPMEEEARKKD